MNLDQHCQFKMRGKDAVARSFVVAVVELAYKKGFMLVVKSRQAIS